MPPEVQSFFDGVSVSTIVAWGIAATLLFAAVRKVWPLLKRLADFLDDVAGEPARPGVPARAGLMERVQRIEHELFPNSGKSLRDQTNRIEEKLVADNDRISSVTDRLDEHITTSARILTDMSRKDQP